jgi:hypothetical protein
MTRLHVGRTALVQVDMIRWMIEHVGPSDSKYFHGAVWNQVRRHVGDDGMYTQAQGNGWEILFMSGKSRGIYVDIEDEVKAVQFALTWL